MGAGGISEPLSRNTAPAPCIVSGGGSIQRSPARSASLSLRDFAHLLCRPAITTVSSLYTTSASRSSWSNGSGMRPISRSMLRSRKEAIDPQPTSGPHLWIRILEHGVSICEH